jgi:GMC oxidoreductase
MGNELSGSPTPWGEKHREFFDGHFANHLMVFMFGEDLPVATNRVTLDPDVTDSSGLPAAHVEYALHQNDIALAEYGIEKIFEATRAVGAVETNDTGVLYPPPGWHLTGTCRMGNSPEGLGAQQVVPDLGSAEPVRGRRQHADDGRRGQPDVDDRCARLPGRGVHHAQLPRHHVAEDDAVERGRAFPVGALRAREHYSVP